NIGDTLINKTGNSIIIEKIEEKKGLFIYHGNGITITEKDISSKINFNNPVDRLKSKNYDTPNIFDLRYKSQIIKNKILKSSIHGFVGGKIELFPHQLYIASEVTKRMLPRVLLADEVGLGKTIEACLVLHHLLITEQIERVLVIVPESLTYQWFIELFQRFNLLFRIVNSKYSLSLGKTNPFLDGDLCLTSINFLTRHIEKQKDILDTEWDMVIIDEVHNIKENTESFTFITQLLKKVKKVLLLTATPEQLGIKSHFERLKLLDPERYSDYDIFIKESDEYNEISKLANNILENKNISTFEHEKLSKFLGNHYFDFFRDNNDIIRDLLDRHGIGRVMFRNTRKIVRSFPKRIPHLIKVNDKIDFICELLLKNKNQKFLLITKTKENVIEIGEYLKKKTTLKFSCFHEDLKVIERDRNASWFSLQEGAQILLCSEIGSEGRNFQFASNLILYDLPDNPEILEQRIGRLDRIGQKHSINIYIPYVENSHDHMLTRWYHEGLNAFEMNIPDGELIFTLFENKLKNLTEISADLFEKIINETKKSHEKNIKILENGRDSLLELNSFNQKKSEAILNEINDWEEDSEIEEFIHDIFDYFGINENPIGERTYILTPGNVKTDAFPKIDDDGVVISYNRKKSLKSEKILFMNPDHPYVMRSIELMQSGDYGSASIGFWYSNEKENIFIETIFIAECVAPINLHVNKFMPPTPIRIMLDINLNDYTEHYSTEIIEYNLKNDKTLANQFMEDDEFFLNELPQIIEKSKAMATNKLNILKNRSIKDMKNYYLKERERLTYLKEINSGVKEDEIRMIDNKVIKLEEHIKETGIR
ncbi:MAG TPA: SNF2-related protein, partial [Spirochaetota bacterium]|nr:SNF2-related protein [Spirochaetota bacterium]